MLNDEPPLIEDHCNNTEFLSTTRQSVCGLRVRESKVKAIPIACGVGVHGLRHFIFVPLLDANGKVT
jgi:hypothetical protein